MKNYCYYSHKICNLFIAEEDRKICKIYFSGENIPDDLEKKETELTKEATKQFDEYLSGKRKKFDLPLILNGTDFQITVWKALQNIPYGKTCSYAEIASIIGNPKAFRAVGMANNRNPIPVIIPCHRVIGHDGSLTGYAGGLELKQKLLELESGILGC